MAGEQSVIREFLVALGFKTDETALKNFTTGISKASKAALGLGAAVTAMATTIAYGIQRFASNLEQLYFASQRTGSAATNLMAFDRAMQNFGASAGEGLAAVEGLAHALRTNPGNVGWIEGFIGPVKRLKDGTIDAEDALERLGQSARFNALSFPVQSQIAGQWGISEKVLLGLRNGDFSKELARMREEVARLNLDKATRDAHDFEVQWRDIKTQLEGVAITAYDLFTQAFGFNLKDVKHWLDVNGPEIQHRIRETFSEFERVWKTYVKPTLTWIYDKLVELDRVTDGWSTKIGVLLVVLKKIGALDVLFGLGQIAFAFIRISGGITGATLALSGFLDLLKVTTGEGPGGLGTWVNKHLPSSFTEGLGKIEAELAAKFGSKDAQEALAYEDPLRFLELGGHYTQAQAAGILANLKAESGLNPRAENKGHYGIAQWDEGRQKNFAAWAGHDIHGSSLSEQLNFLLFELMQGKEQYSGKLLRAQDNAASAAYVISDKYERHMRGPDEDLKRERLAARIDQTTNINVYSSGNPVDTGKAVADKQDRVNAQLARNVSTAVQ